LPCPLARPSRNRTRAASCPRLRDVSLILLFFILASLSPSGEARTDDSGSGLALGV
jgi:hypothetical protein